MIRRVTIKRFKRIHEHRFELPDAVILAGPNNAGKSTLLQAIATWRLGLDQWIAQRKGGKSKAAKRSGVAITRNDFTSVPLREMNLLWEHRRVSAVGEKPGTPCLIGIIVEGEGWSCGLEFQYANSELVYVRPWQAKVLDDDAILGFPPDAAAALNIVHVPSLSGIARDEPRRERGMQALLIGQGRPGEILRNLLWEIAENDQGAWNDLVSHIRELFSLEMRQPAYSQTQPYILCEYHETGSKIRLDISNVGSGTLQVLLLFAFLYARPATVMLLDEPDAHQHVILQKQVYERVRKVARERGGQLIVATHSEILLDATDPSRVIGFFGEQPRALASRPERNQVREALKRVTTTELLLGREAGAILYLEGRTDEKILAEWARVLNHEALQFLQRPMVHWLGGRSLPEAKSHFFAMKAVLQDVRALCLLDQDNRDEPGEETTKEGLVIQRWRRYEIENYLLQPEAIKRFIDFPLVNPQVDAEFWRQVPQGTDLFGDHVALVRIKASEEFLVPLLEHCGRSTPKSDLYLLASVMNENEIHPEIREKLDRIAELLNP